jgi:hypothetical protein
VIEAKAGRDPEGAKENSCRPSESCIAAFLAAAEPYTYLHCMGNSGGGHGDPEGVVDDMLRATTFPEMDYQVSRRFRLAPLQNCLFTPELQWQARGKRRISQGLVCVHWQRLWWPARGPARQGGAERCGFVDAEVWRPGETHGGHVGQREAQWQRQVGAR